MCPERVKKQNCADGERTRICVPADYIKFELPEDERPTYVKVGVDIKDIPKVNDKDFSITMNAYFIVKWQDELIDIEEGIGGLVEVRNISEIWTPDFYIYRLKKFELQKISQSSTHLTLFV